MVAKKSAGISTAPSQRNIIQNLFHSYSENTSSRLKTVDSFLLFIMFTGIFQFLYFVLVSDFPFNAFISGFASAIGQFVLTASLRSQVNPANKEHYQEISPERAFADFAIGSIVLHFFVFNFLG